MSVILLVISIILFVLGGLAAHGNLSGISAHLLISVGLAFFAGSFLPAAIAAHKS